MCIRDSATAEDLRADLLRFNEGRTVLAMDDATALLAVAGTTQAVGAVGGQDQTQAVGAVGAGGGPVTDDGDEPTSNRTRTYAIILAILLALLVVAGFFLLRNLGYLGGSASFNLPSVAGKTVQQATTKLEADGLVVRTTDQISPQKVGTVLSTDPAANSLVKKGDTVMLKVAVGAPVSKVTVPSDLTGITSQDATALLQAQGLTATIVKKASTTVQNDYVISTNPSSGTKVDTGSPVILTVSSGPANVS